MEVVVLSKNISNSVTNCLIPITLKMNNNRKRVSNYCQLPNPYCLKLNRNEFNFEDMAPKKFCG